MAQQHACSTTTLTGTNHPDIHTALCCSADMHAHESDGAKKSTLTPQWSAANRTLHTHSSHACPRLSQHAVRAQAQAHRPTHMHKHMHAGVGVVRACLCITAANQQHPHPALQTLPTCCPSIPTRHATAPGGLHHSHTALSYAPTTLKARTHTCATHPSAHQQTQALNQQTHPSLPLQSHNLHMHARMCPCTALLSAAAGAH